MTASAATIDLKEKKRYWRYDVPAAIVVFLVALPLCLGIALASEAPLFSGIITGIVGGIVVGFLSGSSLSVSGPAAGLTVLVAAGIRSSGAFEVFLCAVVLCGVLQLVFAALRFGFLATLFPNSVVKGMLSAIGITIILKQVPHALGNFGGFESDMAFWELFGTHSTWGLLKKAAGTISIGAVVICAVSLLVLRVWESLWVKSNPFLSRIPGPLICVILAASINWIFSLGFPGIALQAEDGHLVQLPHIQSWRDFVAELRFPDFSAFGRVTTWSIAATLATIASIETLLSVESTDKLDPKRRVSNTNRELLAQGFGNIVAGSLGGIPMTSVIVRSSANIYAGAKSRMSAILHGFMLLFSVLMMSQILNLIPLASLAAVLIAVGYKLSHPKLIKSMYQSGWDQFVPFIATIIAILFTDLLKGVTIGLLVGLAFVLRASYYSAILVVVDGKNRLFRFTKDVTFIHKIRLRKELGKVEPGSQVYFDATRASYIDSDVFEMIHDFAKVAPDKGIQVELKEITKREKKRIKDESEDYHGKLQEAAAGQ